MPLLQLVLRAVLIWFLKPVIPQIKSLPPFRRASIWALRGRGPLTIPAGPILITYPPLEKTGKSLPTTDDAAAVEIGKMLTSLGLVGERDWETRALDRKLNENERKMNLIILGGSQDQAV